jgi:hypothetical protein
VDGTWSGLREVDHEDAVLVRPDQFIAWRAVTGPTTALSDAVATVLTA